MSGIGPELPPHLLAKRKRRQEEETEKVSASASGATQSKSPDVGEKRRRVMGPAMPPAALDERPSEPARPVEESDSEDDDGFGPVLPPSGSNETEADAHDDHDGDDDGLYPQQPGPASTEEKPRRDEWMMIPPKQDDLAARMDPTKPRARGFNTGKGARAPNASDGDNSAWHETPEQKQKRLADEMMGVAKAHPLEPGKAPRRTRDAAAAGKTQEHKTEARGPSLVEQHRGSKGVQPDDDPSQRAFDRDKDMGAGVRIGHAQRREMLTKAANFSSKFAGGSYL